MQKAKIIEVVVKKEFTDRYTGIRHKVGKKLEVTEARLREIRRSGDDYVEMTGKQTPEVKKESK